MLRARRGAALAEAAAAGHLAVAEQLLLFGEAYAVSPTEQLRFASRPLCRALAGGHWNVVRCLVAVARQQNVALDELFYADRGHGLSAATVLGLPHVYADLQAWAADAGLSLAPMLRYDHGDTVGKVLRLCRAPATVLTWLVEAAGREGVGLAELFAPPFWACTRHDAPAAHHRTAEVLRYACRSR